MIARAVATNIVQVEFEFDIAEKTSLGQATVTSGSESLSSLIITATAARKALVYVSTAMQQTDYTIAITGLFKSDGTAISAQDATATFRGITATGPRVALQDQRLKIDLDNFRTTNGDFALLTGDSFIKEQVYRAMNWDRALKSKGLVNPTDVAILERSVKKTVANVPGVLEATVQIEQNGDSVLFKANVKTDQTKFEVVRQF